MSHSEQPDRPEPVAGPAEPTPAEPSPAEITLPLPVVPPVSPLVSVEPAVPTEQPSPARSALEPPTAGLPLLDLLAPPGPGQQATRALPTSQPAMPPLPPRPSPSRRGWPLVVAITAGVLLLGLIGWVAIGRSPTPGRPAATTAPSTSPVRVADGYQFTQHAAREDTDCAGNSYGQVADFFRGTPCSRVQRSLFTSTVDGRPVVVSVATVRMADEPAAAALKQLADTSGTGNIADLLRAGVRLPGAPASLTDATYASTRGGSTVVIVESDYTDPALKADQLLERISDVALQLGG